MSVGRRDSATGERGGTGGCSGWDDFEESHFERRDGVDEDEEEDDDEEEEV